MLKHTDRHRSSTKSKIYIKYDIFISYEAYQEVFSLWLVVFCCDLVCTDQGGDVDPNGEHITGIRVHIDRQGKLYIWGFDLMNPCAVNSFNDWPNLWKRKVQGKPRYLKQISKKTTLKRWFTVMQYNLATYAVKRLFFLICATLQENKGYRVSLWKTILHWAQSDFQLEVRSVVLTYKLVDLGARNIEKEHTLFIFYIYYWHCNNTKMLENCLNHSLQSHWACLALTLTNTQLY